MSHQINEVTGYVLEIWTQASLIDYAHLVLAVIICGWFFGRYGRKLGT